MLNTMPEFSGSFFFKEAWTEYNRRNDYWMVSWLHFKWSKIIFQVNEFQLKFLQSISIKNEEKIKNQYNNLNWISFSPVKCNVLLFWSCCWNVSMELWIEQKRNSVAQMEHSFPQSTIYRIDTAIIVLYFVPNHDLKLFWMCGCGLSTSRWYYTLRS